MAEDPIELLIEPRPRDIGGFEVRRLLPVAQRRSVGPFVFFDQMGPATFAAEHGVDVRPHPHIGLATVTYLFQGEILHRDTLGSVQVIRPGDVNWMTAGSGIAHSERTPAETRSTGGPLFGIQSWVALPKAHEEADPAFFHHPARTLPKIDGEGKAVTIIAGTAFGRRAPVATFSETLYCDVMLKAGAKIEVPIEHEERAIQPVLGRISVSGHEVGSGSMLVLRSKEPVVIEALDDARLMLLGGARLDGPRNIWWNFVSSSKDRIEQAKADWKAGRFGPVPGETEFIPLPE
ncbi:pirin family protein [Dongia sedimenti]|uniref:Pirin family protein n=1 Tax=Dongia sedimenti TaxID=3064282 RepID=A0ABU0YGB9_9PROT|nr:pirin family protein [Rhodospirillaceae bacterium R-7]